MRSATPAAARSLSQSTTRPGRSGSSSASTDQRTRASPTWTTCCPVSYRSATGMGMGIVGARRLMDDFGIESSPAGTTVDAPKVPAAARTADHRGARRQIAEAVARRQPGGLIEEIQQQNQALLRALDELQRKQQELVAPQPRARGHQSRRRGALRRARRESGSSPSRRRAEVAIPLEHDPRVPHAGELDHRAVRTC